MLQHAEFSDIFLLTLADGESHGAQALPAGGHQAFQFRLSFAVDFSPIHSVKQSDVHEQ